VSADIAIATTGSNFIAKIGCEFSRFLGCRMAELIRLFHKALTGILTARRCEEQRGDSPYDDACAEKCQILGPVSTPSG
jgi:hypothetical protein